MQLNKKRRHSDLPDGLFSNLTNLLTLQLNAIGVHHFPGAIFSATEHHSLEHLELRGNALTAIPHDALARLPALRYLDLSTNPLGPRIDKPIEHDRLEELLLNACALEHIGAGTFAKLPALRKLHLSVNERLSDIDPDAFGRLSSPHQAPALTDLYLVEDDLTTLDSRTVDWLHLRLLAVRLWNVSLKTRKKLFIANYKLNLAIAKFANMEKQN